MRKSHSVMSGGLTRRGFLELSAGAMLSLSLSRLSFATAAFAEAGAVEPATPSYQSWDEIYRSMWKWDKITFGSHTNACMPGGCPFYVYARNGIVWRAEQVAPTASPDSPYPDYAPLGCQKGAGFHKLLYTGHRLKYPLKRVGERGQGKWKKISWDEALNDVADAIIDAIDKHGSDSIILDAPQMHAGSVAFAGVQRMLALLGAVQTGTMESLGDNYPGFLATLGKHFFGYSYDNLAEAELIVLAHENTAYTRPALYHFFSEARYKGVEIFQLSPDYNATALVATTHVPVRVGTDAAFWLGVCHHLVKKNLYKPEFIQSQTDLPLLVNVATGHFLRGSEVDGSRDDQLFYYDEEAGQIAKASRSSLAIKGRPALSGTYTAALKNGTRVTVTPVFELVKKHLLKYSPEVAAGMCGVDAGLIVELAEKMAAKKTCAHYGLTSGKHYHGDLMERSFLLAMAMTGNWGKPGTGVLCYSFGNASTAVLAMLSEPAPAGLAGLAAQEEQVRQQIKAQDPEANEEVVQNGLANATSHALGLTHGVPFLYHHANYKEVWNKGQWQDPAMTRGFGEMFEEATKKGWIAPDALAASARTPQVYLLFNHNPLRRMKQAANQYAKVLFPKCKMIWAIETRLSSSAMYADILLPAAWYYEKYDVTYGGTDNPRRSLIEPAVTPAGEARPEWEIVADLMKHIAQRAIARGLKEFSGRFGRKMSFAMLGEAFTMGGAVQTQRDALGQLIEIEKAAGTLPRDYTLEKFSRDGVIDLQALGLPFTAEGEAAPYQPGKPFCPLQDHVAKHKTYPTYSRRAQFYIDHDWYLSLGESLPVHKDTPKIGGNLPFRITGGHPRHSIHSLHQSCEQLAQLHRGQPVVHVNPKAAAERGVNDGDTVRLFNEAGECQLMAKVTPTCAPDQVIVYLWDAMLFKNWKGVDNLLVGQPKALQFAGGYDQIGRYYLGCGLPAAVSHRGVRVDFKKA